MTIILVGVACAVVVKCTRWVLKYANIIQLVRRWMTTLILKYNISLECKFASISKNFSREKIQKKAHHIDLH